jgi:hypothetical protein
LVEICVIWVSWLIIRLLLQFDRTVAISPNIEWNEKIDLPQLKYFLNTNKPIVVVFPEGRHGTVRLFTMA